MIIKAKDLKIGMMFEDNMRDEYKVVKITPRPSSGRIEVYLEGLIYYMFHGSDDVTIVESN